MSLMREIGLMSRFLGKIVTKLSSGKSLDEWVQGYLLNFCLQNELTDTNLKKYLSDPSPTHKSYYLRTHIGTATIGDYKPYDTGLIVTADEGCGYTWGHLFPIEHSPKSLQSYRNYKIAYRDDTYQSFHNYFIFKTCDRDYTELADSTKE